MNTGGKEHDASTFKKHFHGLKIIVFLISFVLLKRTSCIKNEAVAL